MPQLFLSVTDGSITINNYLLCAAFALVCGIIAALASAFRTHTTKSFLLSMVLLPFTVQTVIMMVNGNVGTGIAVAGAFSLVRFRSVPGRAREIASIFIAMAAGLTCAAGYVAIAAVFTATASLIMIIASCIPLKSEKEQELKIAIPESLNYNGVFNDIFDTYTARRKLTNVKCTNMGSLYKLTYRIVMKDPEKTKEMIDSLRCRNGNLEISMAISPERSEEL